MKPWCDSAVWEEYGTSARWNPLWRVQSTWRLTALLISLIWLLPMLSELPEPMHLLTEKNELRG